MLLLDLSELGYKYSVKSEYLYIPQNLLTSLGATKAAKIIDINKSFETMCVIYINKIMPIIVLDHNTTFHILKIVSKLHLWQKYKLYTA